SGKNFEKFFGAPESVSAEHEFLSKTPESGKFLWVLVQTQAACDHAQDNAGLPPFYLGLEIDAKDYRKNAKLPAALWKSPVFFRDSAARFLLVNARFALPLSARTAGRQKALYRLRDQVLGELTYALHTYASRPGIVAVFETKAKT